MDKFLKVVLCVGVLLRIFIAATTYHSDVVPYFYAGEVIKRTKILEFYDYLWQLDDKSPDLKIYSRNLFNYPPAVYFTLGGSSNLLTSILPREFKDKFFFDITEVLSSFDLKIMLILLKIPLITIDIATALVLMKIFRDKLLSRWVFIMWMFNPVTLYATSAMGQYDIIPVFFVVLSIYMYYTKPKTLKWLIISSLALGVGACFKIFPLLFVVPLVASVGKLLNKLVIFITAPFVYFVSIAPFLNSEGFRKTALVAGQTTKSLYAKIDISGGESIILYVVVIIFMYLIFLTVNKFNNKYWNLCFMVLLTFFSLTHYHPQWFLWITPFLIIDLIQRKQSAILPVIIALVSYFSLVLLFEPGLNTRLFSPLIPELNNTPGIITLLKNSDIYMMKSLLQSLFVGVAVYYLYIYLSKPSIGSKLND